MLPLYTKKIYDQCDFNFTSIAATKDCIPQYKYSVFANIPSWVATAVYPQNIRSMRPICFESISINTMLLATSNEWVEHVKLQLSCDREYIRLVRLQFSHYISHNMIVSFSISLASSRIWPVEVLRARSPKYIRSKMSCYGSIPPKIYDQCDLFVLSLLAWIRCCRRLQMSGVSM